MKTNNEASIWQHATAFAGEANAMPTPVVIDQPRFNDHPKAQATAPAPVDYVQDELSYQTVAQHPLIMLLNRLVPPGYGTYVVVVAWLAVNAATAYGYSVPGFSAVIGNEGALSLAGLAIAYMRRAIRQ